MAMISTLMISPKILRPQRDNRGGWFGQRKGTYDIRKWSWIIGEGTLPRTGFLVKKPKIK